MLMMLDVLIHLTIIYNFIITNSTTAATYNSLFPCILQYVKFPHSFARPGTSPFFEWGETSKHINYLLQRNAGCAVIVSGQGKYTK